MKRYLQTAVSVAATAFVLASCSSMGAKTMDSDAADTSTSTSTSMNAASDFPAGTYHNGDTVVVFNTDGTFVGTTPDGNDWVRGTYTASGNEMTVTDTWETDEMQKGGNSCMGMPGSYHWALSGDTMTTTVVDDACAGRKKGTDGVAWTRTP